MIVCLDRSSPACAGRAFSTHMATSAGRQLEAVDNRVLLHVADVSFRLHGRADGLVVSPYFIHIPDHPRSLLLASSMLVLDTIAGMRPNQISAVPGLLSALPTRFRRPSYAVKTRR
ncbi:hypothetical protein MIND_01429300 [Mycena indigotica]|uniref:Uncharacterized protein n=1 Tax=Mycena indigotica TaxID=2126181 RepID=A0A8H6RYB3_9AGAR|nr:uncharacterized protein MIND_01429300 [Mycena indigotica]KAF7288626.1 hypothetical protein MIND_01429300 [Mycena indigotica]